MVDSGEVMALMVDGFVEMAVEAPDVFDGYGGGDGCGR